MCEKRGRVQIPEFSLNLSSFHADVETHVRIRRHQLLVSSHMTQRSHWSPLTEGPEFLQNMEAYRCLNQVNQLLLLWFGGVLKALVVAHLSHPPPNSRKLIGKTAFMGSVWERIPYERIMAPAVLILFGLWSLKLQRAQYLRYPSRVNRQGSTMTGKRKVG